MFQDGQQLRDRVTKICDSFMGSRFDVPSLGEQLFEQLNRLRFEITEARELLKLTKAELRDYMIKINGDCTKE